MPTQVQMNASGIGGVIQAQFGTYAVPANGLITVDSRDIRDLLVQGATYLNNVVRFQTVSPAPAAATAARIVSSVALSNGSLTIANQPDVPRMLGLRVSPGSGTITAGSGIINYIANDGITTIDTIALASAALFTQNTSKGVVHVNSAVISGLVGGTSPLVQLDTTAFLSLMVDAGFVNFAVIKANADGADEAIGTVASAAASISPTTAPNATHTYGFGITFAAPNT